MQCGSGRRFLSLRPAACPIFSFFFAPGTEPRVSVNISVPETRGLSYFLIFLWSEYWASGLCEHFYPWDPWPDLILYFSLDQMLQLGSLQTFFFSETRSRQTDQYIVCIVQPLYILYYKHLYSFESHSLENYRLENIWKAPAQQFSCRTEATHKINIG